MSVCDVFAVQYLSAIQIFVTEPFFILKDFIPHT